MNWIDRGTYTLSTHQQGSKEWLKSRENLLTASKFGKILEGNVKKSEILSKDSNQETNTYMVHGIIYEPVARNWYCSTFNVKVRELGLAVPKWDTRIGASLDGEVEGTNGSIEIKCPATMYGSLYTPQPDYSHIPASHYAQMQGGMKICCKEWCDYIVYSVREKSTFVERIPFSEEYWNKKLYPAILKFLEEDD